MDDREFPPNDLRIDSKDSLSADCRVEGLASHLVSSSDENENQLDRDGNEVLTGSDTAMGRQNEGEQDSINNNENTDSGGCAPSCKDSETERRSVSVPVEPQLEKKTVTEKQAGGKRSPRSKRGSSKKSKGAPSVGTTAVKEENTLVPDPVCAEGAHEANEDSCQQEQKQTLPSLFSLLREEVEQMDSKILPLCLHQIAETYFQEEEYEKAMKFIQLERLYHEQLLANLSSIQEQWERKWKATVPSPVTAVRNSAKELSNEELEKLTKVCSSHQQPLACKHKLVAAENTWESSRFLQLTGSERSKEKEAAAFKSAALKQTQRSAGETNSSIKIQVSVTTTTRCTRSKSAVQGMYLLEKTLKYLFCLKQGSFQEDIKACLWPDRTQDPPPVCQCFQSRKNPGAAFLSPSGTETFPGGGPKEEDRRPRAGSRGQGRAETPPEAASPRAAAGRDRTEEQHRSAEPTPELEPHESTGRGGRPPPGCLSSGRAGKDNGLQPRERQLSKDVGKIEEAAGEPGVKLPVKPMVDTLLLTDADYVPPDLLSAGEDVQADRNLLASKRVAGSSETAGGQLGDSDLNQQHKQLDDDGKSPQDRTASNMCPGSNRVSGHESTSHSRVCKEMQNTAGQEEEKVNHEEQEDLFLRFLNGNIIDSEESFANLANEEDFDTVPDISPERASYSSLEALSLDDSFSSLDELARRIEIAEIAPAEGLVSILKKRDDREGKTIAQVQQRQTKRRVRFQEMEDTLDQDEAAGGSCILLVLLCVATVFLSVGGTALYCTFGDMESPMCKDFAANVDFYYTQILQRMEELKHWVAFS